ncbi:MAG: hypothetical protein LBD04_08265, partial [Synergistaceae bacterium]|nr:hypothetical protein [Synergistaceae bacterium]
FVEFPVFGGAQMTVGRQVYDAVEAPYFLDSGVNPFSKHMAMGTDSWLYDRALDSIGLKKTFGAGTAWFYVTHSTFDFNGTTAATIPPAPAPTADDFGFWELYLAGQIQFSERFGFDIGIQYLLGDDSANQYSPPPPPGGTGLELSNIYTAFGGLRFNFNENIALKGMYYLQGFGGTRPAGSYTWLQDDAKAWRAVIDVKQDMLKFTSLWLEYDMLDQGFFVPTGARALFNNYDWAGKEIERVVSRLGGTSATAPTVMLNNDLTIWRIAAQQQWNDKIATFEYFANATVGDVRLNADGTRSDGDITQWGVGVAYQYNPSVLFGLSYEQIKFSDEVADGTGRSGRGHDPSQIRFRTQVLF